ncbi:zinc finger protein 584 isoform X1 [Manis javanica]|uniref:zinc finger protein 584 isoform X1 n=1 Tax=Manis javanica TaxID=9974 RepID=UPI00187994BE|nr:zinc finger protein 584 isoform X1 [Manis javanica]XP_017501864.2 zinc finger protein 584 isoform X1 [Manis javanica]
MEGAPGSSGPVCGSGRLTVDARNGSERGGLERRAREVWGWTGLWSPSVVSPWRHHLQIGRVGSPAICQGGELGWVTFEDVAVYFSGEEWEFLNLTQRSLYRDVMLENFELIGSLGFAPSRSHVVAQLEGAEEPWAPSVVNMTLVSKAEAGKRPGDGCLCSLENEEAPPKQMNSCRAHLSEKPFLCGESGKDVPAILGLLQHQAVHSKAKAHRNTEHKALPLSSNGQQQRGVRATQKPFKCSNCGEAFLKAFVLLDHLITHSRERQFRCPAGRSDPRENSTLVHHRKAHTRETSHMCNECGKAFSYPSKLRKHQKVHTGIKPFKCGECGKTFSRKDALVLHQRVHTGERPYECRECGKAFSVLSTLIRHRRVHIGEKPFECRECGKFFKYNHSFILHRRVHTGERPYECSECGKAYVTRSGLYQHWKVHTGERPYECSLCGKTFTTRSYRNRHQQFHTEEKSYECTECRKAFKHSSTLLQHQKVHAGERQ